MKSISTVALLALLAASALPGCQGKGLTVIPQDAHSLDRYAQGLKYKQEGRYLLAREQFELARSTARDMDMTRRCEAEIAATDRAIRELR